MLKSSFAGLTILLTGLAASGLEHGALRPGDPNDTFFSYQWGLAVRSQSTVRERTDILHDSIQALPGSDSGWSVRRSEQLQRDISVAVIDSGLDTDHEDIRGQVLKNEAECIDGRIPISPTVDKDGNGFVGDCMGWSFVDNRAPQRPADDDGHGTHIAGIIAARSNNGIGISGFSNRIKILPLKVYDRNEANEARARNRRPIPERVARAIDYAVTRGVSVINISMGWPRAAHTELVAQAIQNAISHGVFIVAGAGNDQHDGPVFPCAEVGVICVGAIDMDGVRSRFSNNGGQVDMLAPGGDVLSLYPMGLQTFFGPRGYEVLSGTSQAAPYVSGALATLRGIFQEESYNQIKRRLLNQNPLNLEKSIQNQGSETIFASFKGDALIEVDPNRRVTIPLRIENLGQEISQSIRITSLTAPNLIHFSQTVRLHPGINVLNLAGVISSNSESALSSFLKLRVQLGPRSFDSTYFLAVNPALKPRLVKTLPSANRVSSLPVYQVRANQAPTFYSVTPLGADLRVDFSEVVSGQIVNRTVTLWRTEKLFDYLPGMRVDLNSDGADDFLFFHLKRRESNESEPILLLSLFDQNLNPLFPGSEGIALENPPTLPRLGTLRFLEAWVDQQRFLLPAVWNVGDIPTADLNPNPFDQEETSEKARLYALEILNGANGKRTARYKLLTNYSWLDQLDKNTNVYYPETVQVHGPLIQNESDFALGRTEMLISYGLGTNRRYALVSVGGTAAPSTSQQALKPLDVGDRDIRFHSLGSVLREDASFSGNAVTGIYAANSFRSIVLSEPQRQSIAQEIVVRWSQEEEPIQSVLQIYAFPNQAPIVAYETDRSLKISQQQESQMRSVGSTIYRYSYLPGRFFSQRFVPMVLSRAGSPSEGIYVDNSLIFARQLGIWSRNRNGQLDIPVSQSVFVPPDCYGLNPNRYQNAPVLVLQCGNQIQLISINP